MYTPRSTELFWFRNDLRLRDHPALAAHCDSANLVCVYCLTPPPPWCNLRGRGPQRQRFLLESLAALQAALAAQGQMLLVVEEAPASAIPRLAEAFAVRRVGVSRAPGVYEAREVAAVAEGLSVPLQVHSGTTLFRSPDLPFPVAECPGQYTPFREAVTDLPLRQTETLPRLPPPPKGLAAGALPALDSRPHPAFPHRGGEPEGAARLQAWLWREQAVDHYRETRNALQGLFHSSQLSPWLASGCLSAVQVANELRRYEGKHGSTEHSEWFWRELLWREFFHWRAYRDRHFLFRPGGTSHRRLLKTFDARGFARWCAGDTDYPLVNALMHQLTKTGWLSNRGRQIAASCLINELGHDWRYGAAFFEKHLIDHDVACNYGNWQYIAGVGADPRGGRHFNLARQAASCDPDGEFVERWDGRRALQPRYATDAADWPLEPDDDAS